MVVETALYGGKTLFVSINNLESCCWCHEVSYRESALGGGEIALYCSQIEQIVKENGKCRAGDRRLLCTWYNTARSRFQSISQHSIVYMYSIPPPGGCHDLSRALEGFQHWCSPPPPPPPGKCEGNWAQIPYFPDYKSHSIISRTPIFRFEQYCCDIFTSVESHA